jgi:protein SCO1/2
MNKVKWMTVLFLLVVSTVSYAEKNSLPPTSVYQLQVSLENQSAKSTGLDVYKGHPVLVTMFYASCPHVCPMLVSTIKLTESKLSAAERADLRVLAISIDPERDTPEKLWDTLERHSVDTSRWSMARPKPADVRSIAGVFGIKYKKLPDGAFNHSTKIVLLDRDGVEIASTDQLGRVDESFLQAIKKSFQ